MEKKSEMLRAEILEKVRRFQLEREREELEGASADRVPVSGKVFDGDDVASLVDSSLDFWLTSGRHTDSFEESLARYFGLKFALMVNSGSSANLVAVTALTSGLLGNRRLKRGDEVITSAVSFPTTINPIFQNGLVPVVVDAELETYNIDPKKVEEAVTDRTKAVVVAHTLGNPFDVERISKICKESGMFLVEDCCDALGSKLNGRMVGTWGDFATLSFYPAHHITTGEGGAVLTSDPLLKRAAESIRDWGRDCWCKPGCDNTCGKRFGWKVEGLPENYDHKYIYSNIGYNLKATDMQAAIGVSQLRKLPSFIEARKRNFCSYFEFFRKYERHFVMPESCPGADASHFGYLVNIREGAPFSRNQLVVYLESKGVATRMLFGGNIVRQPAYRDAAYRVYGKLGNADHFMNNAFWIGVYPGIGDKQMEYAKKTFADFLEKF